MTQSSPNDGMEKDPNGGDLSRWGADGGHSGKEPEPEHLPLDPEALDRALQNIAERERGVSDVMGALERGARLEFQSALDIDTRNLSQTSMLEDVHGHEERLCKRHNDLCIARRFADAVLRWRRATGEEERQLCIAELEALRRQAKDHGFFLKEYTPEFMKRRLTSPLYLVTEAQGRHPSSDHVHNREAMWAADCNVAIPESRDRARPVLEFPKKGDINHDKGFVRKMRKQPHTVASIDDITCMQEMDHLCLAGAARSRAFHILEHEINPERMTEDRDFRIRYIAAAIAKINGLRLPTGEAVSLREDIGIGPIGNERSKFIFETCRNYSFVTAYELVDRECVVNPEAPPEEQYKIIVTWWMMVAKLNLGEEQAALSHEAADAGGAVGG